MSFTSELIRGQAEIIDRRGVFIAGQWRDTASTESVDIINPATEEVCGRVALATAEDVEDAIAAARTSWDGGEWRDAPVEVRARALETLADRLEARIDELALLNAIELGTPVTTARGMQASPIGLLRVFAAELRRLELSEPRVRSTGATSLVTRESVGVVTAIVPWNTPTNQFVFKVGPALAAGCSVIVKAASRAPLVLAAIADTIEELTAEGLLPAGVFSMLVCRHAVSAPLIADPRIDMVSFTGSTEAGRRIGAAASGNLAKVTMELGGKSAAIVLEDADLDAVIASLPMSAARNAGQTCVAITRVLVPRSRHDEIVTRFAEAFGALRVGDPLDPGTDMGPVATAGAREEILGHIAQAQRDGAVVVRGGSRGEATRGYFVEPTLLANVTNDMRVAQEEIFGPVSCIIAYEDEDEAVRLANDSPYGLSGAVFGGDVERATSIARRIRSGVVSVNCSTFDASVPFGGMKGSGVGREGGVEGLEEYFDIKTLHLPS